MLFPSLSVWEHLPAFGHCQGRGAGPASGAVKATLGPTQWRMPNAAVFLNLTMCLQGNVLFPSLTVWEHLRMFGAIKGLGLGQQAEQEAAALLSAVALGEQRDVRAAALSGGQKRRLQVC